MGEPNDRGQPAEGTGQCRGEIQDTPSHDSEGRRPETLSLEQNLHLSQGGELRVAYKRQAQKMLIPPRIEAFHFAFPQAFL